MLDRIDRKLLNLLQTEFPVVSRPFLALANELNISENIGEQEVLGRVKRLKEEGIIRQISAIFDGRKLGYQSVLVAMKFATENLDAGAEVINRHPGVSHNYARNGRYNLWFTITVPKTTDLQAVVEELAQRSGAEGYLVLPIIRLFKIGVALDMVDGVGNVAEVNPTSRNPEPTRPLTSEDIEVVKALQEDIPLVEEPFRKIAEGIGMTEDKLLERARLLLREGRMRRFAAVLRHQQSGYTENAMIVWKVPEHCIEAIGEQMASFPQVSHCYQRPVRAGWPYSIFTMLHGRSKEQCEETVRQISQATGIHEYRTLYSTKEYKKVRVKYFV